MPRTIYHWFYSLCVMRNIAIQLHTAAMASYPCYPYGTCCQCAASIGQGLNAKRRALRRWRCCMEVVSLSVYTLHLIPFCCIGSVKNKTMTTKTHVLTVSSSSVSRLLLPVQHRRASYIMSCKQLYVEWYNKWECRPCKRRRQIARRI